MLVNVQEIVIKSGRRAINNNKVTELADSIVEIGLINPITIDKNMVLIAGRHRLEAYKKLLLDKIEANVIDTSDLKTELIEIDENLIRSELHFTESGDLMKRRKAIYEELHPETKAGSKGGWHNNKSEKLEKTESDFSRSSFVSDTAAKTGKSKTVIKEELQIANNVIPEVKEVIKNHSIPKTEAIKIARLKPTEQMEAAKKFVVPDGKRVCITCGIEKTIDLFGASKSECKNCVSFRKRVGGKVVEQTKSIKGQDVLAIIHDMAKKEPSEEGRGNDLDNRIISDYTEFIKASIAKMNFYLNNSSAFDGSTEQDEHYLLSVRLIGMIKKMHIKAWRNSANEQ